MIAKGGTQQEGWPARLVCVGPKEVCNDGAAAGVIADRPSQLDALHQLPLRQGRLQPDDVLQPASARSHMPPQLAPPSKKRPLLCFTVLKCP